MLRWAIYILAGLAGIVGLLALVGWTLPVNHSVSRTITLDAPRETVFDVITEFARAADWRPGVTRVEMLPDDGKGPLFREHSSMGTMLMRAEVIERPARVVTRIVDPSLPFSGTWTHVLESSPGGRTRHTITEDGEIYNVFFRAMARFIFGYAATIEEYQAALAKRVGGR